MEELKEMVIKNLDSQGVLDAIRAQLRASVFQAILSQEGKPGVSVPANDSNKIMETERGQACAELLRDFMARSGLAQTVGVFAAETRLPSEQMDRRALEAKVKTKGRPDQPLLLAVLNKLKEKQAQREVEEVKQQPVKVEPVSKAPLEPLQPVPKQKEIIPPIAKIPERSFPEPISKPEPQIEKPQVNPQLQKPELKPLARASALAPLERAQDAEEKKFDFDPRKQSAGLNLEKKFAAAGLGRAAVFEDDNPGAALSDPKPSKKDDLKPFSKGGRQEPKVIELPSGSEEDDIEEDIEPEDMDVEVQPMKGQFIESMGTSSLGVDASVDSLALEDYDHVEKVAKNTK